MNAEFYFPIFSVCVCVYMKTMEQKNEKTKHMNTAYTLIHSLSTNERNTPEKAREIKIYTSYALDKIHLTSL